MRTLTKRSLSKSIIKLTLALFCIVSSQLAVSASIDFNLLNVTPEGSWQLREDIETNAKGKKTGTTMRTSMLGSETRNDEKHYWIEVAIDSFKIKKNGKRKKQGDRVVMKSLIPESTLKGDPANVLNNLRGFGIETIVQNGQDDPMRMGDSSGMMSGIMAATQTEIKYEFEELGSEKVDVSAGSFDAQKIRGLGTVDMKILFKKMHIESDSTMWLSSKVPFGTVKVDGITTTNGKQSTNTSELIEFGLSGATSEITKEAKDMPEMPKLF